MTGLLGLLDMGAAAFNAHTVGVSVVGNNVANVATEGYSRQSIILNADALIGGVRADGVLRAESHLLSGRERDAAGSLGYSQSTSAALLDLDGQLTVGDTNIVDALATFFGDLVDLSSAPLEPTLRQQVLTGAQGLTDAFRSASSATNEAIALADGRVAGLADEATQLAAQVAAANRSLAGGFDPTISDQRDLAAHKLAELIGGEARIDPDGNMRFVTGGGVVVVDGRRSAAIEAVPDPALGGLMRVDVVDGTHREDVTTRLDGGQIAGEVAFRDTTAAQTLRRLDTLAFDFASAINGVHQASAAPDGTTGLSLFTVSATADGAAGSLAVDATLTGDPSLLASTAVGSGAGDTTGLLAMLDLREQPLAGGGQRTFVEEAIGSLASVGTQAQQAQGAHSLEVARADIMASMRDSLSGVSLEEEMIRLSQLQRSAEAASTFVSTVDEMLAQLIATL
ncbi:MAG: flagellar hook-associated protein FlgK [Myxococcota bacterium]